MKTKKFVGQLLFVVLISAIVTFSINYYFNKQLVQSGQFVTEPLQYVNYSASGQQMVDLTLAAEKTVHAVVHVRIKSDVEYSNPLMEFFYGGNYSQRSQQVTGFGSGVIVSSNGYIITNNHVIKEAGDISVKLNDNREFDAKIVGSDPNTDIAVLKIEANDLPFISFGNSDNLRLGEWVLAVGNPFNLTSTVTAGIVSAKSRNLDIIPGQYSIESFIQTDAALNPGNSGGALVNVNGNLVGINTAIMSPSGAYSGNSFAVPVSIVKKIYEDIKQFGTPQHPKLGIVPVDVDDEMAKKYGLGKVTGVYVQDLSTNGAAIDAGIEKGDIIVKINEIMVDNSAQLIEQLNKYRPGDQITVDLIHDGKNKKLNVTLRNVQGTTNLLKSDPEGTSIFGATVKNLSPQDKQSLRLKYGVQIVETGTGKFKQAGIGKGFIITRLNNKIINNTDDLISIINNSRGGVYIEGMYPNGLIAYYAFGL